MTFRGRLKRSFFCAVVAVIASTVAVLLRGFLASRANSGDAGDIQFYLLGMPLAPGWFLIRGVFERSSMTQFLEWALVIPLVSVVIDTGIIFGVWQLFRSLNGNTNKPLSS
jgi:O-antigen/teichoic acid export membrane protein